MTQSTTIQIVIIMQPTRSMSRSNLPISSGNETSLLFEASNTSNDDRAHNETGNTDNWLRLKHTITAHVIVIT